MSSEHDFILLILGANVGAAITLFILVSAIAYGFYKALNGKEL